MLAQFHQHSLSTPLQIRVEHSSKQETAETLSSSVSSTLQLEVLEKTEILPLYTLQEPHRQKNIP